MNWLWKEAPVEYSNKYYKEITHDLSKNPEFKIDSTNFNIDIPKSSFVFASNKNIIEVNTKINIDLKLKCN